MTLILTGPRAVFVPYEIQGRKKIKRDDLPRFEEPKEVILFLNRNPRINYRQGKKVQLEWLEHDEAWALAEFHKGIGNQH